jgi:hypothetical protein
MGEPLALLKVTVGTEVVTGKKTTFEATVKPGLTTVIEAVPHVATFAAGTIAESFSLLTKVVASAAPFQLIVAPERKLAPVTVRVSSALPGATLVGMRGWLRNGRGIVPAPATCGVIRAKIIARLSVALHRKGRVVRFIGVVTSAVLGFCGQGPARNCLLMLRGAGIDNLPRGKE